MKRTLKVIAAVLCLLFILSGCSGHRTSLRIGFDSSFPPYGYIDEDGSYTGFDIELARAVCEMEGWDFKPIAIKWDEKDILLNRGEIDCIWNGFTITGREEEYTVSIPYSSNRYSVTVNANSDIFSVSDLKEKVVGVQAATTIDDYLHNEEGGRQLANSFGLLAQFSDSVTAFGALEEGTLDAVITDIAAAKVYVEESGGKLRMLDESLLEEEYGVAFKKGNITLCHTVNEGIRKLYADGTVDRLAEKYGISEYICVEP